MAFKFVAFATLLAYANAGVIAPVATSVAYGSHAAPLAYAAPVAKVAAPLTYAAPIAKVAAPVLAKTVVSEEYDPNPQYSYGYDINDALTGDSKNQQETRNGDAVQGSYSLTDADGFRRIVDYTADPIHGFNAVVRREPLVAKVAKVAAPVAYAAPIAKVAAPVAYAAPVAKFAAPVAYAAPVAKVAAPLAYAAPVAKVGTVTHHGLASPVAKVAAYAAPAAYYH